MLPPTARRLVGSDPRYEQYVSLLFATVDRPGWTPPQESTMAVPPTPVPTSDGPPLDATTPADKTKSASTGRAVARPAHRRTLLGFVATRRLVEIVLVLILGTAGGLLLFGANFGLNMVSSQLDAQDIRFPAKNSPALSPSEFPGLQRYAGQKVDTGPKAKAYANQFIDQHLAAVADGKTYSQVSEASRADPTNAKLSGQVDTLFKGETLRGLLLYAWGWSVVSTIALYAGIAALIGFVIMLFVTIGDFIADPKIARHHIADA